LFPGSQLLTTTLDAMEDSVALALVDRAFGDAPRPQHFTEFSHCEECADHDRTFLQHTRESISRHALGHPGWNPISFVTSEGYRYYVPALARIALNRKDSSEYLEQFVGDLRDELFTTFNAEQAAALSAFLVYLRESRESDIRSNPCPHEILEQLDHAIQALGASR
jgi:hypothetical protein